ncbi:MAG: tail fiber domain-containing protein [Planctomycetota bacterium]|nr:tail fiber domain-containing protein [Planctomycetota bacterium]
MALTVTSDAPGAPAVLVSHPRTSTIRHSFRPRLETAMINSCNLQRTTAAILSALLACGSALAVGDTAFTYQGQLTDGGEPAHGLYEFAFSLWDAAVDGSQIGFTEVHDNVPVSEGLFTVELDFGAEALDNSERWLQIEVDGTPLSPRQPITRAPYAIQTRGMYADDMGNVGIGTTSPQTLLHLVAPPEIDSPEVIMQTGVNDAAGDFFRIANSTGNNEQFIPMLWSHHATDDREASLIIATTPPEQDAGARPLMSFDVWMSDGDSLTDPVLNRPPFAWNNGATRLMTMDADGRIGIGTTSPQKTLHLELPQNAGEGIFLAKAGTTHGTSLTVTGSNNQIFRINLDPNNISGYEQFEITCNGSPVFALDWYGHVTTPLTINNFVGIGTAEHLVDPVAPGWAHGPYDAGAVVRSDLGVAFPLYVRSDNLNSVSPGGAAFCVDYYGAAWMRTLRVKDWIIHHSPVNDDDLGFAYGTTGDVCRIDRVTGSYHVLSDASAKKNVEPMISVLADIVRLSPVRYHYKGQDDDAPKGYGFIAQDVQRQLPDLVDAFGEDKLGLAYSDFGVLAIKAIQEQQAIIESQSAEIEDLEARLKRLEHFVEQVAAEMEDE